MDDRSVVAVQIGRQPRSPVEVSSRCHLDLPVVTAVPPLLDDGTPFPTRFWLGCPLAVLRISRLESAGGIAAAEALLAGDPALRVAFTETTRRYAAERDRLISADHSGPRPTGGVGGARSGVKCLHAQYADHAAGNVNPIGEWVHGQIGPLDCVVPCVAVIAETVDRNPDWKEPPA